MAIWYGQFDQAMGILMDHLKILSFFIKCTIYHLVKMVTSIKRPNQNNHVSFIPHVF
jgi:hypothetical protein